MRTSTRTRYARYRFPAEIIGHGVWLYFRFPLGLRMVEELLAARGTIVSHETVRQWARKFGQQFANQIRRRLPQVGDKWPLGAVLAALIERIEVSVDQIKIRLRPRRLNALLDIAAAPIQGAMDDETEIVSVPIRLRRAGREIRMVIDGADPFAASKPDARLIK